MTSDLTKLPEVQPKSLQVLAEKTPDDKIKTRPGPGGMQLSYVEVGYVVSQLDKAFNHLWEFEILDQQIGKQQVWVRGRLTAHLAPGFAIKKDAYGSAIIKMFKGGGIVNIGHDLKAAASDALKKAASLLGVASDVYYHDDNMGDDNPEVAEPLASEPQRKLIFGLAKQKGFDSEEYKQTVRESFKLPSFTQLTKSQASKIIEELNALPNAENKDVIKGEEDINF